MEAIAMYLEISRMINRSLLKIIENEDVDLSSIKMQFQVKRADSDQVEIKSPNITLADFIKVWEKTGEKVEEFIQDNKK
ncbi:hypothetical protein [Alkanindiges illinoisensis]|uniref:hypothetical protein n=1 Tax=Alkanindiges illinoisensis TaxID=197183 RepID=UPI00047DB5DD|nr:hypothetical protein [Alkanindiges illinoisensis]